MRQKKDPESCQGEIDLNGENLTLHNVWKIIYEKPAPKVVAKNLSHIKRSNDFLRLSIHEKVIYGVNTGFGPMSSHIIGKKELEKLQLNLVRSHASGAGEPLREEFVLAAMVIRLNTLAKGFSGVSDGFLRQLEHFINHRIIPVVPEHGAVGTSGDLVQLAHMTQALIGEGEVFYKGEKRATKEVLSNLGIPVYHLQAKEGISSINGTAVMTGVMAVLLRDIERLLTISIRLGAFSLEVVGAYNDSIDKTLHSVRAHKGQVFVAKKLRSLLHDSRRLIKRYDSAHEKDVRDELYILPRAIQDVYSFRCIPQILGPFWETLETANQIIATEINSSTDNPLIDVEKGIFLHGGNFHGDYIATAIDQLKIPLIKSSLLSERRTNYLLDNKINGVFPPFLNLNQPGLTLALQGLQFVATSTVAQNQTYAFPHSIHSISTNGSNQDIVSMGTDAALFLEKVIENTYIIFAIELISLLQAVDATDDKQHFSTLGKELYIEARKLSPTVIADRSLAPDVSLIINFMKEWDKW